MARWRKLRRTVLERDGWRCHRCGRPGALEVHHVNHDPGDSRSDAPLAVAAVAGSTSDPKTVAAQIDKIRNRFGLLRLLGLEAIYRKPRSTVANPEHRVYPYLLRGVTIERSNQAWYADITYIPVQGGFFYLVAVMDWASRRVLAWRLSNTLDTCFCLEALADALEGNGIPEIFNTDQGSQFTSVAFTGMLEASGIRCSMDGRGRCLDNVFIERLWRSLKYEAVYLRELKDGFEAQRVIAQWLEFYDEVRPHSALDGRTPDEVFRADGALEEQVA